VKQAVIMLEQWFSVADAFHMVMADS